MKIVVDTEFCLLYDWKTSRQGKRKKKKEKEFKLLFPFAVSPFPLTNSK